MALDLEKQIAFWRDMGASEGRGDHELVDESVIEIVRRYLRLLRNRGVPTLFAVLFGSYARGEQRPESDVDILIISREYDEDWQSWYRKLWELRFLVDARIEPTPVGEREFETDDTSIRIEMARREGIVIYPDDERPPVRLAESGILAKPRVG